MFDTDRPPIRLVPLWYGCGVLLLLVVTGLSLMPISGDGPQVNDKLAHFITYAVLSGWFSLLAGNRRRLPVIWICVGLFGIAIEGLQGLTEHRASEWADVVANCLGAAGGLLGYFTILPRWLRRIDARLAALVGR